MLCRILAPTIARCVARVHSIGGHANQSAARQHISQAQAPPLTRLRRASFQRSRNSSTETPIAAKLVHNYDKDLADTKLAIQEIQKDIHWIRHTARFSFFGGWLSDIACAVFLALVVRALWHDHLNGKEKNREGEAETRSS